MCEAVLRGNDVILLLNDRDIPKLTRQSTLATFSSMFYKYENEIRALKPTIVVCPCVAGTFRQEEAYRFIRIPASDINNFIPRPLEPDVPRRELTIPISDDPADIREAELSNMNSWGISLFETPEAARRMAKKYKKAFAIHTHIAKLSMEPTHGVCTVTDHNLHYNLHEEHTANLANSVQLAIPR